MRNFRLCPETNSSSSHAIARGNGVINFKSMYFQWGSYNWEVDEVDPANYLWTSILMSENKDYIEACKKCLKEYLKSKGVEEVAFEDFNGDFYSWSAPSIDHQSYPDIRDYLIDYENGVASIKDEHTFDEYITGTIYTGNDNDDYSSPWSSEYRYNFDRNNTMF